MPPRKREASPAPPQNRKSGGGEDGEEKKAAEGSKSSGGEKFVPPPRPEGLRGSIVSLHVALACSVALFALLGQSMIHPVPEGKFEMKDGSLIDINDFDPVELGPYPKCHPHFGEHEVVHDNGTKTWVKNTDAPAGGPYAVGHPENPAWVEKSHAEAVKENEANRFTWAGLQPNLHLLALATLCVLLGSKHGVWIFTEPSETREAPQLLEDDYPWIAVMDDYPWFASMVCVSPSFVLVSGAALVLKCPCTDWVKMAISAGVVCMCMLGIGTYFHQLVAVARNKALKPLFCIPYLDQTMTALELVGCYVGAAMACGFLVSKHWIINNILGCSFCILGISHHRLSSYKTGAIMLVGPFLYDVYLVTKYTVVRPTVSDVMVSIASVEVPMTLMFPRALGGCGTLQHSMLGLDAIVLPGIFICFLAKWDAVKIGEGKASSPAYLNSAMVAYVLGLITAVAIRLVFNDAQPALLYIVPYVLITSLVTACSRGEFKELWEFRTRQRSRRS